MSIPYSYPIISAQIRILQPFVSSQINPEGDVTPQGATFRSVTTPTFIAQLYNSSVNMSVQFSQVDSIVLVGALFGKFLCSSLCCRPDMICGSDDVVINCVTSS
jgi:hypothetical protein